MHELLKCLGPISPERLLDFATGAYVSAGLPDSDAKLAADTLVQADLWGHQSHGVMRLSWYIAPLRSGVVRSTFDPEFVTDAGAVAVLDGRDAMGQVISARAARDAVRRAKVHGIGAVAIRNSNHFGTAMYFTLMAAAGGVSAFCRRTPALPWRHGAGARKRSARIHGHGQ